jgi:hypothetical protein
MLLKVTVGTCFLLDTVCTFANNLGGRFQGFKVSTKYILTLGSVSIYNYTLGRCSLFGSFCSQLSYLWLIRIYRANKSGECPIEVLGLC